ncbi:MAG: universal stress protein, partial [Solirubrobacteraceae bacterium]
VGARDDTNDERTADLQHEASRRTGVKARLRWYACSSVARGLHEVAESLGADLLVTGSSQRGPLGRVLAGDDARATLSRAPCAVAIAPAGYRGHSTIMHEIGVGYDGSAESERALTVAREVAAEQHARLSAMEVLMFPTYLFAEAPASDDDSIDDLVQRARARVSALEGVEPRAMVGRPAEALARYSGSVDLLVVGCRSYGRIGRVVHGSTTRQLARTALCPLLVLSRSMRATDHDTAVPEAVGAGAPSDRL